MRSRRRASRARTPVPASPLTGRSRHVPSGHIVTQKQFLQRRRLAGHGADPGLGEVAEHVVEGLVVDLATDPQAHHVQVMHTRNPVQADRASQLGINGRAAQVPQLGEGAGLDAPAVADNAHPVRQRLGLGQDVAGQQDRPAAAALVLHTVPERGLHDGVEAGGRLVQQEQLRVGCERGHQRDLLPVALGVGVRLLGRIEREPLAQGRPADGIQPAVQPAEQVDNLSAGKVRPEGDVAGHVGETPVQPGRVPPGVAAQQPRLAAVRLQQAEQNPERGRLASAVRPQEGVHLAGPDGEVQAGEGARGAEALLQPVNLDRVCHDRTYRSTEIS